jgi:hypothetical protein
MKRNNKILKVRNAFPIMGIWSLTLIASLMILGCGKELPLYPTAKTYALTPTRINGEEMTEIEGVVNDTLVLAANKYLIREGLLVNEDGNLIIEQGTTLFFENDAANMLVVERGGKLKINGSAEAPVIMTAVGELSGNTEAGQWGGLHINGNAVVNDRNETLVGIIGNYGKTANGIDDENTASIRYLRIQYAGATQRNIGGALNLNGAGSGTLLDHIQIYKSASHGLRLRGGAVSLRQIMITQSLGTSLRWEAGWRGHIQQVVIYQEEAVTDTLTFIRGESGAATELPFSYPRISNYTIVGRGDNTRGIRLEDQTRCLLVNGIIAHTERAIRTDALDSLIIAGAVQLGNTVLYDNKINFYDHDNGKTSLLNVPQNGWYKGNVALDQYIGSRASGAVNAQGIDAWFLPLNYMGGVESLAQDWTLGWIKI